MKCDELKPLVFSLNDLAYVDELAVEKNFENPLNPYLYDRDNGEGAALAALQEYVKQKESA